MKKTIVFITIMLILLAVGFVRPVEAAPEVSEATATLTIHQIISDSRAKQLESYLDSQSSPISADAEYFIAEADRLDLDWKLVAAIAGVESTFGQHVPTGSYNAWGWGVFTGQQDGVYFQNWADGITQVSQGLAQNYIAKGAVTIDQIGYRYAASPSWAWKVKFFMEKIQAFVPTTPDLLQVTI